MKQVHRALRVAALLALTHAGCTTTADLSYQRTGYTDPAAGRPIVAVGEFRDERPKQANELGVVRGLHGNVLKRLVSEQPVAALVSRAFEEGLDARRLLAPEPPKAGYLLEGTITKLDSNHYFNKEAHAHVDLRLKNAAGDLLLQKSYRADRTDPGFGAGPFASMEELRQLTEDTLKEVIDRALDDDDFRDAIAPAVGAPPPSATSDAASRLEELERIWKRGLIFREEYDRKRREILETL